LLKNIDFLSIVILFLWISFFPTPIQTKYYGFWKIFMGLAFFAMVVSKKKSLKAIFTLKDTPVLIFIAALSLNIFFAQFKTVSLITYLNLGIPLLCIYYLTKEAVSRGNNLVYLARVISLTGICVAMLGVFECLFAFNPIYEHFIENPFYHRYITGFVRPMSTQMHTVPLGTYLLGCLPFNFILFKQDRKLFRLLGVAGIVFNVAVIILTFSRGVFFGLVAMVIFYLFAQGNYRKAVLCIAWILIFVLVCAYLPYPFNRFSPEGILFEDGGTFSAYLADRWSIVKSMFAKHPLTGVGLQHFKIHFDDYYNGSVKVPFEPDFPGATQVPYEFKVTDNMYQTLLAETGIIGFLSFIALALYFLFTGYRTGRQPGYPLDRRLSLFAVLSVFFGFLVNMAAYDLLYWPGQYIYFCMIVGILAGYLKDDRVMISQGN
jgi:O-antigen ligase